MQREANKTIDLEGFSSLILQVEIIFIGLKLVVGSLGFPFADDSLIFCKALGGSG